MSVCLRVAEGWGWARTLAHPELKYLLELHLYHDSIFGAEESGAGFNLLYGHLACGRGAQHQLKLLTDPLSNSAGSEALPKHHLCLLCPQSQPRASDPPNSRAGPGAGLYTAAGPQRDRCTPIGLNLGREVTGRHHHQVASSLRQMGEQAGLYLPLTD